MNVLEARTVCSEALWLGGGALCIWGIKSRSMWLACRRQREGTVEARRSTGGRGRPAGLAGQAHAFDLHSKGNGKSFKKKICCFILSLQNNCRGCNYGEPFERSKQCWEQVNETASSGRNHCSFDQRCADGEGERRMDLKGSEDAQFTGLTRRPTAGS